jgi:twitching motility two-component system response regulator PilH
VRLDADAARHDASACEEKGLARILIVDDSPTEVHVLSQILMTNGYITISASNGEEGIQVARDEIPDLILMDVVMPGMNGFQATRKLSRDLMTKDIPVIIVTTKDQETDREWGLRQGACDYLVKPVEPESLVAKIEALLAVK